MSETPSLSFPELDHPSLPRKIERSLYPKGKKTHFVIGVDEAGRGPLAGPVVAGAFTFATPNMATPAELAKGVTDSKQVSEHARDFMYFNNIVGHPGVVFRTAIVDNKVIDKINILQATFVAMTEACLKLVDAIKLKCPEATFSVLIDGNKVPPQLAASGHDCQFVIKGDSLEFFIAAASICAKVERDAIMKELDEAFPMYGFRQHKGYPTGAHVAAVSKHGPCKHHRMTFAPSKNMKSKTAKRPIDPQPTLPTIDARAERLKRRNICKS